MSKGDYGLFTINELNEAFRKTHDQYHAYDFGVELADKVYNGKLTESEIDERIDKACNKNPHWNKPFVQYGYDFENEFNLLGRCVTPIWPNEKTIDIDEEKFPIMAELRKNIINKK